MKLNYNRHNEHYQHRQQPHKNQLPRRIQITRASKSADILNNVISGKKEPLYRLLPSVSRFQTVITGERWSEEQYLNPLKMIECNRPLGQLSNKWEDGEAKQGVD